MSLLGRVAKGMGGVVFGKPPGDAGDEDDREVERLLHQISDSRHAGDRREAMGQLRDLLQDNPSAQLAVGTMGLPVLLSVLQEDRDDPELLKGAVEALQLSVTAPGGQQQQRQREGEQLHEQQCSPPPPAVINADLICRSPDNVLLLLGLLRDAPEGVEDFYVRYSAMGAIGGLLAACPDRLKACVLSSPVGVVALMDALSSPMEVLRNEALLLLVGLCSGCAQISGIAAFEGAFERLLAIAGAEGGPAGGDVVVQDAVELANTLLRGNLANQRLFREMGHIAQLPQLLQFTPPPPAAAAAAAGMLASSAAGYVDPSLRAAAGAAAAAAASTAVGAAAAAAVAAAGAWPVQVAANYLCLLETARLLLAPPQSEAEEQRAQEEANRRANQDKLGQLGLLQQLARLAADGGGAPSAAVRAQALFCIGDLVCGHAQLQEQLAGVVVALHHPQQQQQQQQQQPGRAAPPPSVPLLQAAVQLAVRAHSEQERAAAAHLMRGFSEANAIGQLALLSTVAPAADPRSLGEELVAALTCQPPAAAATAAAGGGPGAPPPPPLGPAAAAAGPHVGPVDLQLQAGRAAVVLGYLTRHNPQAQAGLLTVHLSPSPGDTLLARAARLLAEGCRRADGRALPACCGALRLLVAWCAGCGAAVGALLGPAGNVQLLVDLVGGRTAAGDAQTRGLAALLLGVCLMFAPGSPIAQQQQQQQQHGAAVSFAQVLDVVLSRVGLSQLFGALDELRGSKAFQAARAAPRRSTHSGRGAAAAAAAALMAEAEGAVWGGQQQKQQPQQEALPFDRGFPQLVDEVAAAVQQLALSAVAAPPVPAPLVGAGAAVAGGSPLPVATTQHGVQHGSLLPPPYHHQQQQHQMPPPPPQQQQQQQHHSLLPPPGPPPTTPPKGRLLVPPCGPAVAAETPPPLPILGPPHAAPPPQLAPAAAAAAPPAAAPLPPSGPPSASAALPSVLAAIAAQLPGATAEEKLHSALQAISQLQASCTELQSRNHSLAADLIRLSQAKPHIAGGGGGSGGAGGTPKANGPVEAAAGTGAADAEARVAAQLRASRAEMEAGAMRQELAVMQERWSALEAQAAAAHGATDEARAAVAKAEADLAALSAAYNGLEAHAFEVEEQLRQLQQQQQKAGDDGHQRLPNGDAAEPAGGGGGGVGEEEVEARIQAALQQDRQQRAEGGQELEARVAAAAAEARAAAEAEAEGDMEDLLACLGEEQAKVEALSARLAELGEDVDGLLEAAVAAAQDDDDDGEGGSESGGGGSEPGGFAAAEEEGAELL